MNKKSLLSKKESDLLLEMLLERYRKDPKVINELFPELAQRLSFLLPKSKSFTPTSGLTEIERKYNQEALRGIFKKMNEGNITSSEAIKGLEYTAVLVEDNNLPCEITHNNLVEFLSKAFNILPGSIKQSSTIPVKIGKIVKNIPVVRGVTLNLTWDNHLVSMSIDIKKIKERKLAMHFVGIAKNETPDVAKKHDEYLTEVLTR